MKFTKFCTWLASLRADLWMERALAVVTWIALCAYVLAQQDFSPVRSAAETAERTAIGLAQMRAWQQAQQTPERQRH